MRYLIGGTIIFLVTFAATYLGFARRAPANKKRPSPWVAMTCAGIAAILYWFLLPSPGKHAEASLLKNRDAYRLVLTGTRLEKSTDLLSRLFPGLTPDTFWIDLPSAAGLQTGKDFLGHAGNYHLFGKIDLMQATVFVELYYDNAANKSTDAMDWNGTYKLIRKSPQ